MKFLSPHTAQWLRLPAFWQALGSAMCVLGAVFAAIYFKTPIFGAAGFALAFALLIVADYRLLFYLLAASLPFSVPIEFSNGFGLEAPSEVLMVLLLGIFGIKLIGGGLYNGSEKWTAMHKWLILILIWTIFTSLLSEYPVRSVKYVLAKIWFLVSLFYIGEKIVCTPADVKRLFWCIWAGMASITAVIGAKHALQGFSFESAHNIPLPFFFNGVSYAAALAAFIPWTWVAASWYPARRPEKWVLLGSALFFALMTILTYKRLAWAVLALLPLVDFAMKKKLIRPLALAGVIGLFVGVIYVVQDNRYYQFAPDFKETIWHGDDLSGHLQATVSGKEISGVERFYRWVAAKNMVAARPLTGFGASTFNQVYKHYADDAFRTYVSDNPEQSTTHNYYLMMFAEQGIPGGMLFLLFCVWLLVFGERQYHRAKGGPWEQAARIGTLSAFAVIFFCLLNELIELDEVGGLFWLSALLIQIVYRRAHA